MTLKKIQILGAQVDMMRALMWHWQQYGEPAPYTEIGKYQSSLYQGALKKLMDAKLVRRAKIKNFGGRGYRPGYEITEAGIEWYPQARALYDGLIKQPTHK